MNKARDWGLLEGRNWAEGVTMFRKEFAGQGLDMLLIGKVLNHKSPNASAIYARFGDEPVRAALDSAAAVIFGGDHDDAAAGK